MSQISNKWILDKIRNDEQMVLLLVKDAEHVRTAQVTGLITTNDTSSTNVVLTIDGVTVIDTYLSETDVQFSNPLPLLFMVGVNFGLSNWPTSGGYWESWTSLVTDNGDGTLNIQLPTHNVTVYPHSASINAVMDPADGVTNPDNLGFPQYPNIIVTSEVAGTPFTLELAFPYDENPYVIQGNEDYLSGEITDEAIVSEPYDRPELLYDTPAMVVLRPDVQIPQSVGSQLGIKQETIYLEGRSWTKQTVHNIKERIEALLTDANGPLSDGGKIDRVRHDWDREPYLNADGKTYETQIRFIVTYK